MVNVKPDYIDFEDDEEEKFDWEFIDVEVNDEELDNFLDLSEKKLDSLEYLWYTRQSKAGNSELTFDAQNKAIKKYARDNKLKLSTIFEEEKSWYVSWKRFQFEIMIDLLEKDSQSTQRKYWWVIFFDISRMARNWEDFIKVEKLYKQWYKFISIKENIVDSAAWMYFFRMICSESIFYSDRQSSKATQYWLFVINRNPYAYLWWSAVQYWYSIKKYWNQKSEIMVNPFHSKIIKRIFELNYEWLKHKEIINVISNEFKTELEVFNNTRKKWTDIFYIPKNEKEISKILLNKERIRYNWKRFVIIDIKFEDDLKILQSFYNRPKDIKKGRNVLILETPKLRIINDELYDNVLIKNKDRQHRKIEVWVFNWALYSDVLKCVCWWSITGQRWWNWNKYRYICSNARANNWICERKTVILEEQIDDYIQREIIKYINIEPIYEVVYDLIKRQELSRVNDALKSNRIKLESKERKLNKMEDEFMDFNNLYDKRTPNAEYLMFSITEIKKQIIENQEEIKLLEDECKKIEDGIKNFLERLIEIIWKYNNLWRDLKKSIVDILLKEILIDEEINNDKKYRNSRDRKTEWGYQKQILKIDLLWEFQFIYKYNKSIWKKQ